jgi:hypothetical protein
MAVTVKGPGFPLVIVANDDDDISMELDGYDMLSTGIKEGVGYIAPCAGGYYNFGTTPGSAGYGVRDSSGTVQVKASGGSWSDLAAVSAAALPLAGGGTVTGNVKVVGTLTADATTLKTLACTGTASVTGVTTLGASLKMMGTTGGLTRTFAEAASSAMSGNSATIPVAVPSGVVVRACQLKVDTLITASVGVSWSATYSGSALSACTITTGQAFAAGTTVGTFLNHATLSAAPYVTTQIQNIVITPNAGYFTAGVVRAVVYYDQITAMT